MNLGVLVDELKLVVPDNAKVLDLRELIQESEIYKNDKETYQAIVDCVLEEINDKRNENENRLEIEKIKLSQLEHENENRLEIEKIKLSHVKPAVRKLFLWETAPSLDSFSKRDNQTVQRSVLNPLADVFGGPGGSNCVVPPQESIGVKKREFSSEEDVSFEMFKQRVHFKNGRYEVELPWKRDSNELSDNFSLAKRRLGSLMRKMQRDKMTAKMVCRCTDLIEFFGVNASPFLLAATIKTHIGKYMEKYPVTVRTLDHCFYVDDHVTGEDDAKSAFDLSSKAAKS
ncbi:DUF1758 domain-containing protein [Trichonephila clavipes]|nr:DUF1758 domain-containing protein [Trichonephila clavipes]